MPDPGAVSSPDGRRSSHRLTRYLRNLVAGTQTHDASDSDLMEQFVAHTQDKERRFGASLTRTYR
jgi:hypothetical protein